MATDIKQQALEKHYEWQGKIEVISRAPVNTREDLSLCYTPGVAQACLEIEKDPSLSYRLTPVSYTHLPSVYHQGSKKAVPDF